MSNPVYIVDLFENIVSNVATAISSYVGYEYGHPVEINETLVALSKNTSNPTNRFPLVCLFTDITEHKGIGYGNDSEVSLQLLIAQLTQKNLSSRQRMAVNFKPTLIPIYNELINQIVKSRYFRQSSAETIKHDKTNRLFWGKTGIYGNNGLIFTDLLDCIEIKNLVITVKQQNC